mgnify:CR=1 FL=1
MIKKILCYIGEFKKETIITPIFVILEAVTEMIIPLLMSMIIDNGVEKKNIKYVCTIGIVMLVISFLSLACGMIEGKYAADASSGFAKNLRRAVFYNIQNYSFKNIDKYSTAGLVTRMTTDVTNIQNAFQMILRLLVRAPVMLITAMFMCFYINAKLSLVFLGAILFLGIILSIVMISSHPYFQKAFRKYDDLNASVQENLTAIRTVKAYVREDHEVSKFERISRKLYDYFVSAEKIVVINAPAMQFSIYTCIILLSWLGAKSIVSRTMTTGQLMSLFTYTGNILMSLMMISMVFVMIIIARTSVERVVQVLDEKSDLANGENPVNEVKDGSVSFNNVDFSYVNDPDKLALQNINVKIKSGETIGVIGGTGSGKSSLVQLIPRLYDITEGSVEVGGVDVRKYDIETLRNAVSMVLQKNVLFSGTIKENLRWGNKNASDEEMFKACIQSQADEFIEKLPDKYDTFIEEGGDNVSGGQKQRLCIARALLKKPKILILDDSTSAVDTKTDALIRKAFKESIPDTTKIIIAQRISSVQDSDKIIVLDDGKIDGFGTHDELLKSNYIYRDVYESQMRGADSSESE